MDDHLGYNNHDDQKGAGTYLPLVSFQVSFFLYNRFDEKFLLYYTFITKTREEYQLWTQKIYYQVLLTIH